MSGLALFDTRPQQGAARWQLLADTRRVPKAAVADLLQASDLVKEADGLWAKAEKEAGELKQQKTDEGWQLGLAEAVAETALYVTQAQQEAQRYADQSEARILDLARALVEKILPRLSRQEIIDDLLSSALKAIYAGRFLHVRAHPENCSHIEQKLQADTGLNRQFSSVTVIPDENLDLYDCVVETELGRLEAGFNQQLSALVRQALPGREPE